MTVSSLTQVKKVSKFAGIAVAALIVAGCSGQVKTTADVDDASAASTSAASTGSQITGINSENVGDLQSVYYFEFDQSVIRSEALPSLSLHAQFIAQNTAASVRLEGHADENGDMMFNIFMDYICDKLYYGDIDAVKKGNENFRDVDLREC